jgi:7-cyano-7-deazaguanine synthase
MKNAIYYSIAAAYAEENGTNCIIGGHNKDDEDIFEDTGDVFFKNLRRTFWSASRRLSERRINIMRPLKRMTKPEVIAMGTRLHVPFELTWSCHLDGSKHCWRCSGCRARREAFAAAGVSDPLAP